MYRFNELFEVVVELSEGNPGAVVVLCDLYKLDNGHDAFNRIIDLGIRGYQIHLGFNDFCKRDIKVFRDKLIYGNCEDMMAYIKSYK